MFTTVLSKNAQAALAVLGKSGLVADAYLAGGSALALHFGHRYSVDFDFFSAKPLDPDSLSRSLATVGSFTTTLSKDASLLGKFEGIKFSYFRYKYPLIAPASEIFKVAVAHPEDIAAMKLVAITARGTKRDFVDLYVLAHKGVGTEKMLSLYQQKYKLLDTNIYTLLRAFSYFDEAEESEMPQMITHVSWGEVKRFFAAEAVRLGKKYLEG